MFISLSSPGLSLYSLPIIWFCAFYPNILKYSLIKRTTGYDNTNPRANAAKSKDNKGIPAEIKTKIQGMDGAHQNGNEAFPLWTAAIITANIVGLDSRTLNISSIVYIGLRLLYNHIYINHNGFLNGYARSVVFFTGLPIPLWLLVKSAAKASL